jgi:hypothetical protein
MKPLARSSLMRPGRVALGVCVPHLRAPQAFETALSHPRRPTIGVMASGMSMATSPLSGHIASSNRPHRSSIHLRAPQTLRVRARRPGTQAADTDVSGKDTSGHRLEPLKALCQPVPVRGNLLYGPAGESLPPSGPRRSDRGACPKRAVDARRVLLALRASGCPSRTTSTLETGGSLASSR